MSSNIANIANPSHKQGKKHEIRIRHLSKKYRYPTQVALLELYISKGLKGLSQVKEYVHYREGLCELCELHSITEHDLGLRREYFLDSYPEFSGNLSYPVPAPANFLTGKYADRVQKYLKNTSSEPESESLARLAYIYLTMDNKLHDRRTTYGKLRLSFAKHMHTILTTHKEFLL